MRLSTRGRYAVMAMAELAARSLVQGSDKPIALSEIAGRQGISLPYLEQLFGRLRRAGLVVSARGPGGGYRLAFPAAETRIADILLAVDEPIRATRCVANSPQGCLGGRARCLTHDLWEELGNQIRIFLASVTLDDVVHRRVLGSAGALHARLRDRSDTQPPAPGQGSAAP